jgi:hypothetical protein
MLVGGPHLPRPRDLVRLPGLLPGRAVVPRRRHRQLHLPRPLPRTHRLISSKHTRTRCRSNLFSLAQQIDRARTVHRSAAVALRLPVSARGAALPHTYRAGGGGNARQNRGQSSHRGRVWHGEEKPGPRGTGACSPCGAQATGANRARARASGDVRGGPGVGELAHVAVSYL